MPVATRGPFLYFRASPCRSTCIQRRIQENTLESLWEAVLLSPTNGLAFARLARQVLAQDPKHNPRRVDEADFFSRYALKWSPSDPQVVNIRAEIEAQIKDLPKPCTRHPFTNKLDRLCRTAIER